MDPTEATMTIERRTDSAGNVRICMTECPLCPVTFGDGCGSQRRAHFENDHDPEEFGL